MRRLFVCLFVAACGGSSGGNGDDTPGDSLTPEELTDALETAECEAGVRCEEYEDRATCDAANILLDQEQQTLLAAIADGTVDYDGEAAKRCAEAIAMGDCSFDGFHGDDPCDDMFKGTVPPGGACFIDQQCANGGTCNQDDPSCDTDLACCVGKCAGSVSESPLAGPCDDGLHVCSDGAYCKAGACAAVVASEGGACEELDACANPMYCNIDFTSGAGQCKTPSASGAACVRSDLRPCSDSRDFCDPNTLKCVRSAAPGASCANGVQCVDYAKCISNQCVADRKLGETCTTGATAPNCAGTLECTGGTCQAPRAGMTCAL